MASCSGLVHRSSHAKLPFGMRQYNGAKIDYCNSVSVTSRRLRARRVGTICAASVGRDHRRLRIDDDSPQEPYFLSLVQEAVCIILCDKQNVAIIINWPGLRSLFVFLIEQPSQLKYIECPGFHSTLKTATLTLVLVALLIVAI
ncbi:hypothetical protein D8674_026798 [Pyrus ussuriensis x Pyrus communis]|uniref:Uncharacterized protein n=1 Tax=Pyrus ussuriensis x Pyrus communis TaxID=2448454 RepID=A0A5N5IML8_9ROSA|nr:hypothetical protein D8674_026798 [Pyrus ussuriensis x Pyrus communis]